MDKCLVKGAFTELMATFDKNENLDLGMYNNEIDFQLNAGIKGLFVNGLSGEYLYMTNEEKLAVTKATVAKAKGKVPVIANICELRPKDGLALLKAYEAEGVDAICVTQPHTFVYTQDYLYRYYSMIAEATSLPVMVYNAPQTNNEMTPATVCKIANNNDNVFGYKDSTQSILHLQSVQAGIKEGKHWECVAGSDATIFPTLMVGGTGIISLISAVFPKPIIDVCELYFAGDIEGSRKKQAEVLAIRTALKAGPLLAAYKYAAELIGVPFGTLRQPLVDASPEDKAKIKANLEKYNLI